MWEFSIEKKFPDILANAIQESLLSDRKIEKLDKDDSLQTLRNIQIVRSPRLQNFLVIHKEDDHLVRRNKDVVNLDEDTFAKLVGAASISKIGKTNKILRSANIKTPVNVRLKTQIRRNNLKSMIQEHYLEKVQRTNQKTSNGICLGFSFKQAELEKFLTEYKSKHADFMQHVTSITLVGDEG